MSGAMSFRATVDVQRNAVANVFCVLRVGILRRLVSAPHCQGSMFQFPGWPLIAAARTIHRIVSAPHLDSSQIYYRGARNPA